MTTKQELEAVCSRLEPILEALFAELSRVGYEVSNNRYLTKVKNIVRTRDPVGIKNMDHYLSNEYRMIYDNQDYSPEIERLADEIYTLLEETGFGKS